MMRVECRIRVIVVFGTMLLVGRKGG
jgi:hypothetical protein